MAEYLIQDTTLTAIAAAIRAKEGSTGAILVSEFANRISAISTGATKKTKTGTFTTNSSGTATVNCGFKPDYVIIINPRTASAGYIMSATAHFTYDPDGVGAFALLIPEQSDDVFCNSFDVTQTSNGFSVLAENIGWDHGYSTTKNAVFNYYAVKYE